MPASDPPPAGQRLPNRFTGWRVFAFLGTCVALLIATLVVRENITGRRALEKARQRWADAGFPLEPSRYRPAPVPDEENFAAVPSLHGILEDSDTSGPLEQRIAAVGPVLPGRWWPRVWRTWAESAPDWIAIKGDLEAGKEAYFSAGGGGAATRAIPDASPAEDAAIKAAAEAVFRLSNTDQALIDEWAAAVDRPQAQFVHTSQSGADPSAGLGNIRNVLELQARASLSAGLAAEPATRALILARLRDALAAEQTPGSLHAAAEVSKSLGRIVADGLRMRRWDEPTLARLATHVPFEIDSALPLFVMQECQATDEELETSFSGKPLPMEETRFGIHRMEFWAKVSPFLPRGFSEHNRATVLNLAFDQVLEPCRRAGMAGISGRTMTCRKATAAAQLAPGRWGLSVHRHAIFAGETEFLLNEIQAVGRRQIIARVIALAVAVERFRLAEERIPDTAADVVARFLPGVPLDVDGQPLRFQKKGDGFLIYSVGADGVDSWHGTPPATSAWPQTQNDDWLLDFSPR